MLKYIWLSNIDLMLPNLCPSCFKSMLSTNLFDYTSSSNNIRTYVIDRGIERFLNLWSSLFCTNLFGFHVKAHTMFLFRFYNSAFRRSDENVLSNAATLGLIFSLIIIIRNFELIFVNQKVAQKIHSLKH